MNEKRLDGLCPVQLFYRLSFVFDASSWWTDYGSSAGGSSGRTTGKRTRLTAQEVAQKANISVERAEDVIKILTGNFQKKNSLWKDLVDRLLMLKRK